MVTTDFITWQNQYGNMYGFLPLHYLINWRSLNTVKKPCNILCHFLVHNRISLAMYYHSWVEGHVECWALLNVQPEAILYSSSSSKTITYVLNYRIMIKHIIHNMLHRLNNVNDLNVPECSYHSACTYVRLMCWMYYVLWHFLICEVYACT